MLSVQELGAADALEKSYLHQLGTTFAPHRPSRVRTAGRMLTLAVIPAVFAIYLDPDNPTNVVECYTFTVSYEKDEHGQKVPSYSNARAGCRTTPDSMRLARPRSPKWSSGTSLAAWSSLERIIARKAPRPPSRKTMRSGRCRSSSRSARFRSRGACPRSSLAFLTRSLITNTASLDELPRRRFITVRLYYTEDTPADYEPPLFRSADFFMYSIGSCLPL